MQATADIDQFLAEVASSSMKGQSVARVISEPTSDSDGQDAIHITVVFAGTERHVDGDRALDTIVALRRALQNRGDQRTPIINFIKDDELDADVDPELESSF